VVELRRLTTVVYHRDHQALSTAQFCRSGQLATADILVSCVFTSLSHISVWSRVKDINEIIDGIKRLADKVASSMM